MATYLSFNEQAQSAGAVEYADFISAEGLDPSSLSRVQDMALNCIWWWGFSPGVLGNKEYPFTTITPRSLLTWSGSTC